MDVVVVPSNRPEQFEKWLDAWGATDGSVPIVLVEDAPEPSREFPGVARHVAWNQIDEMLGDDAWIISREDSAIRCFGFLVAAEMGADVIVTLDDDCLPLTQGTLAELCNDHNQRLYGTQPWYSPLPGCRLRGKPYGLNRARLQAPWRDTGFFAVDNVMINTGLWHGSLDRDAPNRLIQGEKAERPPVRDHLVPHGQYFSMCGMNLSFRKEALLLMYFPLMGRGQLYRRFDDIWCGILAKKMCDALGWSISVGGPLVYHKQQSNVFDSLIAEAPGIKANETLWRIVDELEVVKTTDFAETYQCTPEQLVKSIRMQTGRVGSEMRKHSDPYVSEWGKALEVWGELCSRVV